jgi:hypothetical protein
MEAENGENGKQINSGAFIISVMILTTGHRPDSWEEGASSNATHLPHRPPEGALVPDFQLVVGSRPGS